MYRTGLKRSLAAMHFFDVPGEEGKVHAHPFEVELALAGEELEGRGYLVDLDRMSEVLDGALDRLRDKVLNDLPEFAGRSPSVENIARTIWEMIVPQLSAANATWAAVTVWERGEAWASYESEIR